MNKQLLITAAYPSSTAGSDVLKTVLTTLKDDFDILLCTHYPADMEVQKLVNYYVYDHRNEFSKEDPSVHFWADFPNFYFKLHKMNANHHSFAVFRNIINGVNLLRDYYDDFIYVEGDCLFSKKDIEKLKQFKTLCKYENKEAAFFKYPEFLSTLVFYSKMNFFTETFMFSNTLQQYEARSKKIGSFGNLENFLYHSARYSNALDRMYIMEIANIADYFSTSTLSISGFSNGETVVDCKYILEVARVENTTDKMCVCYLANGDNTFTEPTDLYVNDEKIATLPTGKAAIAIPINSENDVFHIQVGNKHKKTYNKNIIFNPNNYSFVRLK